MKALCVGVSQEVQRHLEAVGIIPESLDIQDSDDLKGYLCLGYTVVIVDINSSKLGLNFGWSVRDAKSKIAVIGIASGTSGTAFSEQAAVFMEKGGDHLLTKPLCKRELVAAIRSTSRRMNGGLCDVVVCSRGELELRINTSTGNAALNGLELKLTNKESKLLCLLARSLDCPLLKEDIFSSIYPSDSDGMSPQIINVYVCKLRRLFSKDDPDGKFFIKTNWGRGYSLVSGDSQFL